MPSLLDQLPVFERGALTLRSYPEPRSDLLALGHKDLEPGTPYRFDNRRRKEDACVFQLTLAGQGQWEDFESGELKPLRAGDAFLIDLPSPTAYRMVPGTAWRFVYLYFTGDLARHHIAAITARRGRCFHLAEDDPVIAPLVAMFLHVREVAELDEATVCAGLFSVLAHLHPQPVRAEHEPAVAIARRFMEEHFRDGEVTVEDISAAASLSKFHLSRRFKATFGISPYAYLVMLRLRRAQELLSTTETSAKDIAQQVGFNDAVHFAHAFRSHLGMTPGDYRRQARGGQD